MIPSAWIFVLLALAAYRLTRLCGWDEFPLAAKVRAWVIGEEWHSVTDPGDHYDYKVERPAPPGKPPETDVSDVEPVYRRPVLAHLVHCPYCIGFYVSLGVYLFWLWLPTETMYVAVPLALSGAVGLISKNWDA